MNPVSPSQHDSILVDISFDESVRDRPRDPLYWRGNVEILVENTLISIGQFPGALILLPSIEGLVDAVTRLRRGERQIDVAMVGDTVSTWFVERKRRGTSGVAIICRDTETAVVPATDLDASCGDAVGTLLMRMQRHLHALRDHPDVKSTLDVIEPIWPNSQSVAIIEQLRFPDYDRRRRGSG
jgi:hypothetical protein